MSAVLATASPRRIKATHRRRRKVTAGHFVQRYYDPQIGRFLSVDPVSTNPNTGASFNRYNYANNNPYKFTDPDGREPEWLTMLKGGTPDSANNTQHEASKNAAGVMGGLAGSVVSQFPAAAAEAGKLIVTAAAFSGAPEVALAGTEARLAGGAVELAHEALGVASVAGVEGAATPSGMRAALTEAGIPGRAVTNAAGTEAGTLHNVSKMKMDVRVMNGGPNHGPRISVTRQGSIQPVNPANGKNLGNISRSAQNAQSHIPLKKDP